MPARPSPTARRTSRRLRDVPLEPEHAERSRRRRGGPRTPFPLLPIIGICVGIGVAYVSQTAHGTQATYQMSALQAQQAQLRGDDQRVNDALDRLRSSARIAAAAQQIGMKPASKWAYVASAPGPVAPAQARVAGDTQSAAPDPVQRLIAALGGGGEGPAGSGQR